MTFCRAVVFFPEFIDVTTLTVPDLHSPYISYLLPHRRRSFGPGLDVCEIQIEYHAVDLNARKAEEKTFSYPTGYMADTFHSEVWQGCMPGWGEHNTPRDYINGKVKEALLNMGEGAISGGILQHVEEWQEAPPV